MKKLYKGSVLVISLLLLAVFGMDAGAEEILVADDFNRPGNLCMGTMSDGAHGWFEMDRKEDDLVSGRGTTIFIGYRSGTNPVVGAAVYGFTLADGTVSVKVHWINTKVKGRGRAAGISYRANTIEHACDAYSGKNAYHVRITPDWTGKNDIELVYWGTVLATANISDKFAAFDLSVTFKQNSHKVYVNGELKIDYTETKANRTGAGYIGLGLYSTAVHFDDFKVSK